MYPDMKIIWNSNFSVDKVLLEHSHTSQFVCYLLLPSGADAVTETICASLIAYLCCLTHCKL